MILRKIVNFLKYNYFRQSSCFGFHSTSWPLHFVHTGRSQSTWKYIEHLLFFILIIHVLQGQIIYIGANYTCRHLSSLSRIIRGVWFRRRGATSSGEILQKIVFERKNSLRSRFRYDYLRPLSHRRQSRIVIYWCLMISDSLSSSNFFWHYICILQISYKF